MSYKKKEEGILKMMESEEYISKNKNLQKEINSFPVLIDRSVFKKTQEEKNELKKLKYEYKHNPQRK